MLPDMRKAFSSNREGRAARRSRAAWLEEVKRWRESGQSAAEYGRAHGLHAGTLTVWGSKLRSEIDAAAAAGHRSRLGFVPVRVTEAKAAAVTAAPQLEVVLRNGRRVLVSEDIGAERLARVLDLVEGGVRC